MNKTISIGVILALGMAGQIAKADFVFGTPTNLGPTVNSSSDESMPGITPIACLRLEDQSMALVRPSRTVRVIPFLTVVCFVIFPTLAKYSGGSRTARAPYRIPTTEDLITADPN
jgi:hypothetical protein